MQDVLVNAFSKEVNANTEVTHFFPQRTISLMCRVAVRKLERRLVGPAGIMATETAA